MQLHFIIITRGTSLPKNFNKKTHYTVADFYFVELDSFILQSFV